MSSINDIVIALSVLNGCKTRRSLASVHDELLGRLTAVCSTLVEKSALCQKDKQFLAENGVRYVGEAPSFLVKSDYAIGSLKRRFAVTFGLRYYTDPVAVGWKPSYWDDPQFMALLNTPCCVYFGEWGNWEHKRAEAYRLNFGTRTLARWLHSEGIHYMGQYLHYVQRDHWKLEKAAEELVNTVQQKLWAGAFVPPQWQPPKEIPDEWLVEEQKIAEEIKQRKERYETPRAWVVTWLVVDGVYSRNSVPARVQPAYDRDPEAPTHFKSSPEGRDVLSLEAKIAGEEIYRYYQDVWVTRLDGQIGGFSRVGSEANRPLFPGMNRIGVNTRAYGERVFGTKEEAETLRARIDARAGMFMEDDD